MNEKRRFVRLDSQVKTIYGEMAKIERPNLALSKNISAGGIRIPLDKKFPKGSLLELEISLPDKKSPIFALGRVMWIKKAAKGKPSAFEAGVRLVSIDYADRLRLFKFIAP